MLRTRVASATDGLYLRNAGFVYGTTSIFDLVDGDRSHAKDERGGINVEAFHTTGDYFYELVKTLSANVAQ